MVGPCKMAGNLFSSFFLIINAVFFSFGNCQVCKDMICVTEDYNRFKSFETDIK